MNRKFDIITDTACDMPAEYLEKNEVVAVPLGFNMDNENYEGESGQKMDPKEFYAKLRDGKMPTTYQVTAEQAKTYIEKSLNADRDVLIITFSSGLSGTSGSFVVAARELSKEYPKRKILVVDSLCASMGEGLLVDYVVKKAETGCSIEETAKYAEDLKLRICQHFTVDNLFHLKRGGRVSTTTAVVGTMLKIKPLMHVSDEGKLVAIGKTTGRKKSLATLVDYLVATNDIPDGDPIFISHGDCIEDVEYVKTLLNAKFPNTEIMVNYVGPVIGAHSGCGTVAIFNLGKHR
jgi:DegV family protein with EDD domain